MANNLNRQIEPGEVVVLRKGILKKEYDAIEERLISVWDGFGMSSFTSGTAMASQFLSDGEQTRYEGSMIDVNATEAWQEEYGKFGERWPEVRRDHKGIALLSSTEVIDEN